MSRSCKKKYLSVKLMQDITGQRLLTKDCIIFSNISRYFHQSSNIFAHSNTPSVACLVHILGPNYREIHEFKLMMALKKTQISPCLVCMVLQGQFTCFSCHIPNLHQFVRTRTSKNVPEQTNNQGKNVKLQISQTSSEQSLQ